jgi:hypothetical protein
MRDAVQGVTPVRGIRMSDRAYFGVPILEWDGAHATYCTNDCLNRHAPRSKQKLKLRMIRSVKFYACLSTHTTDKKRHSKKYSGNWGNLCTYSFPTPSGISMIIHLYVDIKLYRTIVLQTTKF